MEPVVDHLGAHTDPADETAGRARGPAIPPVDGPDPTFAPFYEREHRSVLRLAFGLCGSRTAAEDLAQEAFISAYRNWHRISLYDDPAGWVRRVVINRSVSRYRRAAAETRALMRLGRADRQVPELSADSLALWTEVRRLPKRQAQAIALRYLDGRPIAEIAAILECSENTVKTHLARAKAALARQLGVAP